MHYVKHAHPGEQKQKSKKDQLLESNIDSLREKFESPIKGQLVSPQFSKAYTEKSKKSIMLNISEGSYDIFRVRKGSEPTLTILPTIGGQAKKLNLSPVPSINRLKPSFSTTQLNFSRRDNEPEYLKTDISAYRDLEAPKTTDVSQGQRSKIFSTQNMDSSMLEQLISSKTGKDPQGEFGSSGQTKRKLHFAINDLMTLSDHKRGSLRDSAIRQAQDSMMGNTSSYAFHKLPLPATVEEAELRVLMGGEENRKDLLNPSIFEILKKVETNYLNRTTKNHKTYDHTSRKNNLLSEVDSLTKKLAQERRDAKSVLKWFTDLKVSSEPTNLDDLANFLNSQSALCHFAINELSSLLFPICKEFSSLLTAIYSHSVFVANSVINYAASGLDQSDKRREADCKEMEAVFNLRIKHLNEMLQMEKALIERKERQLAEQSRVLASMRSKLYSDYLVIKNLKREAEFSENKFEVILDENNKISRIITDLSDVAVSSLHLGRQHDLHELLHALPERVQPGVPGARHQAGRSQEILS